MENLENKKTKISPKAEGTKADIDAGVEISKVHGGYFSSIEKARAFCDVGVSKILSELPAHIRYADFGGGEGFLTKTIVAYFREHGKEVDASVVDANEKSLDVVKKEGLHAINANLQDCNVGDLNLITMRAVNHYNPWEDQVAIMKNAHANLADGGFLLNQLSSGSRENVSLRTVIIHLPSLVYGRNVGKVGYRWVAEDEYPILCAEAGFSNTQLAGYAPGNAWGPMEQWERMNGNRLHEAEESRDEQLIAALHKHRDNFISEANTLIESYLQKDENKDLGVEQAEDGSYVVRYTYPIFISRK